MGPLPVVGAALQQEVVVREVDRAIEREDRRNVERQGLDVLDGEAGPVRNRSRSEIIGRPRGQGA